jgi:hypothetical protein
MLTRALWLTAVALPVAFFLPPGPALGTVLPAGAVALPGALGACLGVAAGAGWGLAGVPGAAAGAGLAVAAGVGWGLAGVPGAAAAGAAGVGLGPWGAPWSRCLLWQQ